MTFLKFTLFPVLGLSIYTTADAAAVNPNGIKTLLAYGVSTFFINGKPVVINSVRNLKNPPSWPVIFLLVPFIRIPLLSKDLLTFIISFILLFVRVIPEPVIDETPFLIVLPIILSPVSARRLLSIF